MNRHPRRRSRVPGVVLLLAATAAHADDCVPAAGFTPYCGFERPEDLEVLAGGALLVTGEYGPVTGDARKHLVGFTPADGQRRTLYPAADADGTPDWGAPDCPSPPGASFAPHGIHNAAGSNRLLVVNHGGREAVEFFEIIDGDDARKARVRWRGCVVAPPGSWMNDVAGLPDGGFVASHMIEKGPSEATLLETERTRADTGYVLEWAPGAGWKHLPGTEGSFPNGVEATPDGRVIYVNEYLGDRTYAYDRASGARLWQVAVDAPDNLSWGSDGRLLVASHHGTLRDVMACAKNATQFCPMAFSIVAIDPANGHRVTVIEGGGSGVPMGAGTVAAEVGDTVYIGSFVGDRIAATRRGTGVRP